MAWSLLFILVFINTVKGSTYYIRTTGCEHNSSTCNSPSTNYTERCISNGGGSGLSPVECTCCDESHSCNDDYGRRRLIHDASSFAMPSTAKTGQFGDLNGMHCLFLFWRAIESVFCVQFGALDADVGPQERRRRLLFSRRFVERD